MAKIERIVIVGGGTSGWLSAAYLAKRLGANRPGGIDITLIESSEIGTIGVGEATIPPIRSLISSIGIEESEFMRETSATFKAAIKFIDWLRLPEGDNRHAFYHAFDKVNWVGPDPLAAYWVLDGAPHGVSFTDHSLVLGTICDGGRAPKRITDPPFGGPLEYAYHFDAGLVAELLKKVGIQSGVKHLIGNVTEVKLDDSGAIARLETKEHGPLEADLYIDCSGFGAHLIEKAMGTEFQSLSDTLFCDTAVACQVPYSQDNRPIPPFTMSTAQEAGWIWEISLNNRRGCGHVFSSRYCEADRAEELLRAYIGPEADDLPVRLLKMRVGSRREQWRKNCVAVGLSAGFLEPLESTGIYLVDIALRRLVDQFPRIEQMPQAAARFNADMNETFADVIDFIKLHFALSQRTDSDFWVDNRRPETIPDRLLEWLELWQYRLPGVLEFGKLTAVFGLVNYLQILYGMNHLPDLSEEAARFPLRDQALAHAKHLRTVAQSGLKELPMHRAVIDEIYHGGFRAATKPSPAMAGRSASA